MDDKLLRLAKKINALENELKELSQVKNVKGLLYINSELDKYKKFTNEVIGVYEDFINKAQKEMTNEIKLISKQGKELSDKEIRNKEEVNKKIAKIKEDVAIIYKGINNSINNIQKDILQQINKQGEKIDTNNKLNSKEISEIKKENRSLNIAINKLKDMLNELELQKGEAGKSAYEIACELGFKGTKEEWIKSLHGKDGKEIELRGMRSFSDAPKDNKIYGRKNKKWVEVTGGGGGGSSDYPDLNNKPSINNVELVGNKSLNDLGIQPKGNYALESDIPTKTSNLTNDSGFITEYTETDPTVPNHVKNISQANITSWNNKSNFSGSYNDLSNKPSIPDELKDLSDDSTHRLVTDTEKNKLNKISGYYGTCATGASTAAKVVECENFVLEEGAVIYVKFTNAQTYNGTATLNVNGTGAKDIARVGTTKTTRYYWSAGEVVGFVYDGTNYVMMERGTASTTYYGLTKLSSSATSTSEALALTPKALNSFAQGVVADYPVYSTAGTYEVGDRVRYSYAIYECITAITIAEAWTAEHWTAVKTLQEQIDDVTDLIPDVRGKEDKSNKVTSLSSNSTDTQYPSAKCVYDMIGDVESILIRLTTGGGVS